MNYFKILDELSLRYIIGNKHFITLDKEYLFELEEAYWCALDEFKLNSISFKLLAMLLLKYNGFFDVENRSRRGIEDELKMIFKEDLTSIKIFKLIKINKNSLLPSFHQEFDNFKKFKQNVLVYGTILFSETFEKVLVVQQKKKSNMAFPKGKKKENESGKTCAIRETWEEIGYDASDKITNIKITIFDKITFYVVMNVPEKTKFKTMCKNEITKIFWMKISEIPVNDIYKIVNTALNELGLFIKIYNETSFKFNNLAAFLEDKQTIRKETAAEKEEKSLQRNLRLISKINKYIKIHETDDLRTVEDLKMFNLRRE